jgi:hypothetical protein
MDTLQQIRTAHAIERDLATLAHAVPDAELRGEVSAALDTWRALSHRLTAALCGFSPEPGVTTPRRGRPRKPRSENPEPAGVSGDGVGGTADRRDSP